MKPPDLHDLPALRQRLGDAALRLRLRQQAAISARPLGKERGQLHWENLKFLPPLLKIALQCTGLFERGRRNCLDFRVEKVSTGFDNLPNAFDGYRILHLSDLHLDGLPDRGTSLVPILHALEYDLCVISGDFRFDMAHDYDTSLHLFGELRKSLDCADGIFAVLGNHDFIEMVPWLERLGLKVLLNEAIRIRRNEAHLTLAGIDDPHFYGTHDLARACAGTHPADFRILLAHSPELAREAAAEQIDLYLCGHSHGGQIRLPGGWAPILNCSGCRPFASGSWRLGSMQGYTSRGTGSSGLAVRFCCPPEITLHRLTRNKPAPRPTSLAASAENPAAFRWFRGTIDRVSRSEPG